MSTIPRRYVATTALVLVSAFNLSCSSSAGRDPVEGGDGGDGENPSPYVPWVDWQPDVQTMTNELRLGQIATVYEPSSNAEIAGFPKAFAIDTGTASNPIRRVVVTFSQNDDVPNAELLSSRATSNDGGESFSAGNVALGTNAPTQMQRLLSGELLDIGFRPLSGNSQGLRLAVGRSTDEGETWQSSEAEASFDKLISPVGRTHLGQVLLKDGSVAVPHYVNLAEDFGYSVILLQSKDKGASFAQLGVIARGSAAASYNETSIARTTSGQLLAVFRTHEGDDLSGVRAARSSDDGVTWSEPEVLSIAFGTGAPGPRIAVDPRLALLPNGVLVLTGGRPDNWLAVSWDGSGDSWESAQLTYVNRPAPPGFQFHGSSGYTGIVASESNRLFLVGDNCAPSWGCPAGDSGFTVDGKHRVWRKLIDVLTPGVGKIDLQGKLRAEDISVEGNMRDQQGPRTGLAGAFDGSTKPWSGALRMGDAPGELTVALDRDYLIHRIGLAIGGGRETSAKVRVSVDGERWSDVVLQTDDAQFHAMRYFDLPQAARSRFVRVEVQAADCPGMPGTTCALLDELELYADVDSFENDAVGGTARGYQGSSLVKVVKSGDDAHGRALRVYDTSASEHARVSYLGDSEASEFGGSFSFRPVALPGGFLFDVLAKNNSYEVIAGYHFAIATDRSVRVWNAINKSWTALSAPGAVTLDVWSTMHISANLLRATIRLNDGAEWVAPPSEQELTSLVGHAFASGGTAPVGDDVLVDDVLLRGVSR